jgi:hypothetical protein
MAVALSVDKTIDEQILGPEVVDGQRVWNNVLYWLDGHRADYPGALERVMRRCAPLRESHDDGILHIVTYPDVNRRGEDGSDKDLREAIQAALDDLFGARVWGQRYSETQPDRFFEYVDRLYARESHGEFFLGPLGSQHSDAAVKKIPRVYTRKELAMLPKPSALIEDMLVANELATLYGPPGTHKTFLALDMVLSIVLGIPWHGRKVSQGEVIYVAAEGTSNFDHRVTAWEHEHNGGVLVDSIYFSEAVQLMDKRGVDSWIEHMQGWTTSPALVVFDTLARCMVGGDENKASDMSTVINALDWVRESLNCAVLVIHHTERRQGHERGSTALRGAMNTMLSVDANGDETTMECVKQKDWKDGWILNLQMKEVALPDGGTSLVATKSTAQAKPKMSKSEHMMMDVLRNICGTTDSVLSTEWIDMCVEAGMNRQTAHNTKPKLVEKGLVRQEDAGKEHRYFLPNPEHGAVTQ